MKEKETAGAALKSPPRLIDRFSPQGVKVISTLLLRLPPLPQGPRVSR